MYAGNTADTPDNKRHTHTWPHRTHTHATQPCLTTHRDGAALWRPPHGNEIQTRHTPATVVGCCGSFCSWRNRAPTGGGRRNTMRCKDSRSPQQSVDLRTHHQQHTTEPTCAYARWPTCTVDRHRGIRPGHNTTGKSTNLQACICQQGCVRDHAWCCRQLTAAVTAAPVAWHKHPLTCAPYTQRMRDLDPLYSSHTLLRPTTPNTKNRALKHLGHRCGACTHRTCVQRRQRHTPTHNTTDHNRHVPPPLHFWESKGGGLHTKLACSGHDASFEQGNGAGPLRGATRYALGACS
jgi:hypothetical protein